MVWRICDNTMHFFMYTRHGREATEPSGDYEEYVKTDSNGAFALRVRGDSMEQV